MYAQSGSKKRVKIRNNKKITSQTANSKMQNANAWKKRRGKAKMIQGKYVLGCAQISHVSESLKINSRRDLTSHMQKSPQGAAADGGKAAGKL